MAKPINLRDVRKARARAQKRDASDVNAAKFGRTRAEKVRDADAVERAERILDQHRREEE